MLPLIVIPMGADCGYSINVAWASAIEGRITIAARGVAYQYPATHRG